MVRMIVSPRLDIQTTSTCVPCVRHRHSNTEAGKETKDGFRSLKKHRPGLQAMPHRRVKLGEHVLRGCEKS